MMSDHKSEVKERMKKMLKKIKSDFNIGSSAYPPFISLSGEQIEWLIQQAGKVERYENGLKEILDITEDTMELEVYTDIVKKALGVIK
jgi:hypothetical protein